MTGSNIQRNSKRCRMIPAAACFAVCLLFILLFSFQTRADDAVEIRTADDLLKMAENPGGSYRLMTDIDMRDVTWVPVDFTGTFDGNGFALLNVKVQSVGGKQQTTIDGNRVEYDTAFSGFFASLVGARVSDLRLLGIDIALETTEPTFAGGIAGYMEDSTVTGCEVRGKVSLESSGHSFGVGGIAGFGSGAIENTKADMTLLCNDTDTEYKDEQFMGGAYAAGFIDLKGNRIKIDGYDSDHGYVHDGGLVGMYILYPEDSDYMGYIEDNEVNGRIRFFEDNEDRRAYCEAFIGEIMNWSFESDDAFSEDGFERDEVFDYDTVLLPHDCKDPQYETTVTEPTETENGFTLNRCKECGYTFLSDYTVRKGSYVPEEPESETVTEPETEQPSRGALEPEQEAPKKNEALIYFIIAILVILIVVVSVRIAANRRNRR